MTKLLPDLTIEFGDIRLPSVYPNSQGSIRLVVKNQAFGDYPSGHAVGTAATTILADFFGQNHSFTIPSAELGGVARSYSSFAQAGDELGLSRIYAGLHVRSSFEAGQALGIEVGNYVLENVLL